MTLISNYFTQEDVTHSDTALRLEINNEPPKELWPRIFKTAQCMDVVRSILGYPVFPSSWYRCPELEKVITAKAMARWLLKNPNKTEDDYIAKKSHPKGEAVDFTCHRFGTPFAVAEYLASRKDEIRFDQLIYEHTWVHISFCSDTSRVPRLEVLTLEADGSYSIGINRKNNE